MINNSIYFFNKRGIVTFPSLILITRIIFLLIFLKLTNSLIDIIGVVGCKE